MRRGRKIALCDFPKIEPTRAFTPHAPIIAE
jgi:hypothetical protein